MTLRVNLARTHPAQVLARFAGQVERDLGITVSIGLSANKFLAKIASAWRKPDGLTVIAPERMEAFLHELPVDALWGVGPVTAARLRERGITQLIHVRTADPAVLHEAVGSLADWLEEPSARKISPSRRSTSTSVP